MSLTLQSPAPAWPAELPRNQFKSEVAPRLQWNHNSGYCGETSFICAGMHFGQYCSQWTARSLASHHLQFEQASQLLLGSGNDVIAARKMRLQASEFYGVAHDNSAELIVWVKNHLFAGHVPIIGVFMDGNRIESGFVPDPQYDHIVPILGFASDSSLEQNAGVYVPGEWIILSDNGLDGIYPDCQFFFPYEVKDFQGTREQANGGNGHMYTLPLVEGRILDGNPLTNYGIAIEGILDLDGVCIPVRLSSNTDYEPSPKTMEPPPGYSSPPFAQTPLADGPPDPIEIELTAAVHVPDDGAYNLYRYDDFAKVPVAGFNAAAGDAVHVWRIPSGMDPTPTAEKPEAMPNETVLSRPDPGRTTIAVTLKAMSNETVVFRAVPASAP